jgi:hypothetical protein
LSSFNLRDFINNYADKSLVYTPNKGLLYFFSILDVLGKDKIIQVFCHSSGTDFNTFFKMDNYYQTQINFNNYYFIDTRDIFKQSGLTKEFQKINKHIGKDSLSHFYDYFFQKNIINHHLAIDDAVALNDIFEEAKKDYPIEKVIKLEIKNIDIMRKIDKKFITHDNYKFIFKNIGLTKVFPNKEMLFYFTFCNNSFIPSKIKKIRDIIDHIHI